MATSFGYAGALAMGSWKIRPLPASTNQRPTRAQLPEGRPVAAFSACCQRSRNRVPRIPETIISTMCMLPPLLSNLSSGDEHADEDGDGCERDREGQRLAQQTHRQRHAERRLQELQHADALDAAL